MGQNDPPGRRLQFKSPVGIRLKESSQFFYPDSGVQTHVSLRLEP